MMRITLNLRSLRLFYVYLLPLDAPVCSAQKYLHAAAVFAPLATASLAAHDIDGPPTDAKGAVEAAAKYYAEHQEEIHDMAQGAMNQINTMENFQHVGGAPSYTPSITIYNVACFTGESLLRLADGSLIMLKDVRPGARISMGASVGLVTAALFHPINATTRLAKIPTAHGELIGTPDHPVWVDGQWMEIEEAHTAGLLTDVTYENKFTYALFNLEIDGHIPGKSMHAYEVNGVMVSGLGDNEMLNSNFPRQRAFKSKQVAHKAQTSFFARSQSR